MIIDSHFHTNVYYNYEGTLEKALQIATEKKILLLSNSVDLDSYYQTIDITKKSKFIIPCFGIHPQVAHEYVDRINSLEILFNEAVAFGEIGLDHYYIKDESQYPSQYTILEHFFKAALEYEKLVILHLDGAEKQGMKLIKKYSLPKVIIHGFKGSIETLNDLLDLGCYFSVGGNMIMEQFKDYIPPIEWTRRMKTIQKIPKERLLLETDGPCRIEPNAKADTPRSMPDYIFNILQRIAQLRGVTQKSLQKSCLTNFKSIIKKDPNLFSNFKSLY
ncbi:MAG TPA: TatD family hydrolase [Candidatus Bathyarchaeia archaeon]|nr:TatD family hydrolase [Candidatus Bathyarchaeia archaeon]